MQKLANQQIISGFLKGDSPMILDCYEQTYPMILKFVTSNSGTEDEAKEIIWESFTAFFKCCKKPNFQLTCKFSSFIYRLSHNIWMKRLRTKKRNLHKETSFADLQVKEVSGEEFEGMVDERNMEQIMYENDMRSVVKDIYHSLSDICQSIIKLRHEEGRSHKEIASELSISESLSKTKLHRCNHAFTKLVKSSKHYKDIVETYPFLSKYN